MAAWPSSNDYTAAIQSPQICFRDSDLKSAAVERNRLTRMPKVWTGNFAQVYELTGPSKRVAVKCFTRSAADLTQRYSELSKAIAASKLPYFVDFRYIPDEMLVNGQRYPVVKMQWIEGDSLDKFVEAHLFRPRALVALAGSLMTMVRDLEYWQLAHGDLQHGNLVITPSGLKLVDYDGMFVPAFRGKPAPEMGLPSYQHPRRTAADYSVGLDRFALMVMCTGLCALALDPSLWYEFYTGDNLLFTAADFKDPHNSRLFQRLLASPDSQLKMLSDALRSACAQPPMKIALPPGAFQVTTRHVPWWVTSPAPAPSKPASAGSRVPRIKLAAPGLRHIGAGALGFIAVVTTLAWLLAAQAALVAAVTGTMLYLLERAGRYAQLPALVRRREVKSRLAASRLESEKQVAAKTNLERELETLPQQERRAHAAELKKLQDAHASPYLSAILITRLTDIAGIGPYIIGNLQKAGIRNADELKHRGADVRGVGAKRRAQILDLLSKWEREAGRDGPTALAPDVERRITHECQQTRLRVLSEIESAGRRITAAAAETIEAESQLKQIHVPTFHQFLKNTF
jgi:hypothetical protein